MRKYPPRRPVTRERIERVMSTPYANLDRADKKLQSTIKKHGSYEASLKAARPGKILGGYNGGIQRRDTKGYASWDKDTFKDFVSSRKHDKQGRFVADTPSQKITTQESEQEWHEVLQAKMEETAREVREELDEILEEE